MQFRDLQQQYCVLKDEIDSEINKVLSDTNFISGLQVTMLEEKLARYVNVKHCITCGNGTDALTLALMAWEIGPGDAVFVPDFTFFASAETVALAGAMPIFVDIDRRTFNISPSSLKKAIEYTLKDGKYCPKAIIAVDMFGQPADYIQIKKIAEAYNLFILEDGAQGFGGMIKNQRACSFGDISTTSFFPAKPLGCYGDGGAVFTDNDHWAEVIRSLRIHGKGTDKYDNIRIGMNSRLDTLQAAVLMVKLKAFECYELHDINEIAKRYTTELSNIVTTPYIINGFESSWAQYTILVDDLNQRTELMEFLVKKNIPTMIYYPKGMNQQKAFNNNKYTVVETSVSAELCNRVLSLPIHPYLSNENQEYIIQAITSFFK